MNYLDPEHLEGVFGTIQKNFSRQEEVPDYLSLTPGIERLSGVLQGVQMDTYYPTLHDKAAYLLVQINAGHFFPNGNKRLALVTTGFFLDINGHMLKHAEKQGYHTIVEGLFPEFTAFEDYPEFIGIDYGTYNISIIIAESRKMEIPFDSLKLRVRSFLEWAITKKV